MLKYYGTKKIGIIKTIQETIKKMLCSDQLGITFKGNVLRMERAPEPSDLLWENCEQKFSIIRIAFIYTVTFLIVLAGFGVYSGLDYGQQ